MKKIVFCKLAQSRSRKFLPKKEACEKQFSQMTLSGKNLREPVWKLQTVSLQFTKSELFYRCFSRILTANFRTPIFQNTSQVVASTEAYSGPCETSKMEFFCKYNKRLKAVNCFTKKLHLRCFTRFCARLFWSYKFYLSNVQVQSLL